MAPTGPSQFATLCILLLSLLVAASAGDYGFSPKPEDTVKPDRDYGETPNSDSVKPDYGYGPKPNPDTVMPNNEYGPNPTFDMSREPNTPQPDNGYNPQSNLNNPDVFNHEYGSFPTPNHNELKPDTVIPDNKYSPKPDLDQPKADYVYVPKPDFQQPKVDTVKPGYEYGPKPRNDEQTRRYGPRAEKTLSVGIEGLVLCKLGSKYVPIQGAVTRIVCWAVDQNGYETTPFSCQTGATDAKGYFFKILPSLGLDDGLKLKECKAYLENSPMETCRVPTDVNKGITGALLSSFRILDDKNLKLYSLGPFFYTPEPTSTPSVPSGY